MRRSTRNGPVPRHRQARNHANFTEKGPVVQVVADPSARSSY